MVGELLDSRMMEFSYAMVIGGGFSTLLSLIFCDCILYEKSPYRTGLGDIIWETVMFNMYIGGAIIYSITNINRITNGQGDEWTIWIVVSMIALAILMTIALVHGANSRAKKSMETKQMWKDFNKWLLVKGKSTDEGFNNFINRTIDEVKPDMEGRMESPSYDDLKEFSQEKYPDFYKYLLQMEGTEEVS